MKHKYEDLSDEARELVLHGDNSEHLYRTSHEPIAKNLAKKMAKGTFEQHEDKRKEDSSVYMAYRDAKGKKYVGK